MSGRVYRRELILLFVLLLADAAQAAESPDWLKRMAQAIHMQNYQGTMVYMQNGRMDSMRVVHRYQDGREQERLQSLSGDAREVLRDNEVVTCILPKDRSVMVDRRGYRGFLQALSAESLEDVTSHYDLKVMGSARIGDRDCRLLIVKPKDDYRYGYRIWADELTAIPLKVELLSQKGEVLEQLMFTQIEYPASIPDSALQPRVDSSKFVRIQHNALDEAGAASQAGGSSWVAEHLPPGFQQVLQERQHLPGVEEPVEHLLFTDGLASVSVFMAPEAVPKSFKGVSRRGAVNAYGKMVGKYHVTVMGEVPQATVEYIGDHLRYEPVSASGPIAPTR